MRILYLTQWYLPEPVKLNAELATGLRDLGHDVTVLTGYPNYPAGKLYDGYRQRLWQHEEIDGIPVIRMPLYADHSHSSLRRALNHASLSLSTTCLGPGVVPPFDLIYGARPITLGLPAWLLSRLRRKPFVVEIADMWPETLSVTGMVDRPWMIQLIKRFSNWVCHRAAAVRVDTPGFRENLIEKGIPADKVHFIPDWVDTDAYVPKVRDEALARELGLADRFNILYAGTLGLSQGLESVLDVAARLTDLPHVQFVFSGGLGVERDRLQEMARQRGLTNVRFLGYFPFDRLSDVYALADAMLIQLRDTPLARITIPHKIYAYLAVGKPILASIAGNTCEIVESARAGVTCDPCNPDSMLEAVRALCRMSAEQRAEMGQNGRDAACQHYDKKLLVAKLSDLLESVMVRRSAPTQASSVRR